MLEVVDQVASIFVEAAPYLLLGFAFAGLSKVFLDREKWLGRALGAPGSRSVALASVVGAPLPLCSCSVLPAALGLRRQGASKGATASFLISVPETDVVSVLLTYGLLGPVMAVARPVAALVTAFVTGMAVDRFDASDSALQPASPESTVLDGADCDCEVEADPSRPKARPWYWKALHFGFVEFFDDITGPLIVGLVLAGLVGALVPAIDGFGFADRAVFGYLVALGIGIPTYVCATATTPVAVGLIAAGMSPGAALVLLLVGPATNVASFVVLEREFGRRLVMVYVAGIVVVSVGFGLLVDAFWGSSAVLAQSDHVVAHQSSWWQLAASIVLATLLAASVIRTRLVPKLFARLARRLRSNVSLL